MYAEPDPAIIVGPGRAYIAGPGTSNIARPGTASIAVPASASSCPLDDPVCGEQNSEQSLA